jgi:hypothetical protein
MYQNTHSILTIVIKYTALKKQNRLGHEAKPVVFETVPIENELLLDDLLC